MKLSTTVGLATAPAALAASIPHNRMVENSRREQQAQTDGSNAILLWENPGGDSATTTIQEKIAHPTGEIARPTHTIQVGSSADSVFEPDTLMNVLIGDVIVFEFWPKDFIPKNHLKAEAKDHSVSNTALDIADILVSRAKATSVSDTTLDIADILVSRSKATSVSDTASDIADILISQSKDHSVSNTALDIADILVSRSKAASVSDTALDIADILISRSKDHSVTHTASNIADILVSQSKDHTVSDTALDIADILVSRSKDHTVSDTTLNLRSRGQIPSDVDIDSRDWLSRVSLTETSSGTACEAVADGIDFRFPPRSKEYGNSPAKVAIQVLSDDVLRFCSNGDYPTEGGGSSTITINPITAKN